MAVRVVFVCLGNICRSPLAESIFRHQIREKGVEHLFEVDSAGTADYHLGRPPDARSVATARARGVVVDGRGRQIGAEDLDRFDYVIVMDRENLAARPPTRAAACGAAWARGRPRSVLRRTAWLRRRSRHRRAFLQGAAGGPAGASERRQRGMMGRSARSPIT